MAEPAHRQTLASKSSVLEISALGDRTLLRIKAWQSVTTVGRVPVALGGLVMPLTVGEMAAGPPQMLCLGPAEWLLIAGRGSVAPGWRERLEQEASSQNIAVVDVSDGLCGFALQGAVARDLLSKGCGVDVDVKHFSAGRCVRTHFAQIPVVIGCLDECARYELHVARSYGEYLLEWLSDASMEWTLLSE